MELVDLNFYDVAAFADGFSLTVAEYLLVESFHLDQTVVFVQAWRQVVGKEVELSGDLVLAKGFCLNIKKIS